MKLRFVDPESGETITAEQNANNSELLAGFVGHSNSYNFCAQMDSCEGPQTSPGMENASTPEECCSKFFGSSASDYIPWPENQLCGFYTGTPYLTNYECHKYISTGEWEWTSTWDGMIKSDIAYQLYCGDDLCVNSSEEGYMNSFYDKNIGTINIYHQDVDIDELVVDETMLFYLQEPNIYGERGFWEDDDLSAAVTSTAVPSLYAGNTIIDLDLSEIEEDTLNSSGTDNSTGITFSDYVIDFDEKTGKPKQQKPKSSIVIDKSKSKGQY